MNPLLFRGVFINSSKAQGYKLLNKLSDLMRSGEVHQYIYSWILFIKKNNSDDFIMLNGAFSGDFIGNFIKLKWKLFGDYTHSSELVDFFVSDGVIKVKLNKEITSTVWFDKYKKILREEFIDLQTKKKVSNEFLYFPLIDEE